MDLKKHFYFMVKCPGCGHDMKYMTDSKILTGKNKKCPYCGKSFRVKDRVMKEVGR